MKKTLFAKIAAALMLLQSAAALAACGGDATASPSPASTTTAEDGGGQIAETEAETTNPYDPGLPDQDFGGYNFRFAVRGYEGSTGAWHNHDIVSEELNGEALNDAVYNRNLYLKEKYNVDISVLYFGETGVALTGSEMSNAVKKSVMAGDDAFDAIISSPYDSVGYMQNGWILDLNEIDNLDLSKPWWDQNALSELSFGSKVYFTVGELSYIDNKATQVTLFSKQVVNDFGIANPYEAVKNGTWTIDRLISDANSVSSDLDGDGKMDENDRFGYTYWQDDCFGMINSTGNAFGRIVNGLPELTLYSEKMVSTWEKLINFLNQDSTINYATERKLLKDLTGEEAFSQTINAGHTLYSFGYIFHVIYMRQNETDFGVLPKPKYDEAQDRYYCTGHAYGTAFVSVPVTTQDTARTGYILEAFSAKSMELVTPAFYDITLVTKSARDEESVEMIDLIFRSKKYDIGYYFMWGDLTNKIMNAWNAKKADFTSLYQKAESKALKDLEKAKELFE